MRIFLVMMLAIWLPTVFVQGRAEAQEGGQHRLKAHIAIVAPGALDAARANKIYDEIIADLSAMYALSRDPAALKYRKWRRYNAAPYLSSTHGNRYVSNYANGRATGYADHKTGVEMPVGAIFAKDSYTVTDKGEVFGGALFLMEKLRKGLSPETANWRYWMILPDGSIFGDTEDDTAGNVAFCHTCHKQQAAKDHLFYVPEKFRRDKR